MATVVPAHLPGAVGAPRVVPRVIAALGVLVTALGVHLTWRVFVASAAGQQVERYALDGATHGQYRLWTIVRPVLDVVSVSFVVLGILTVMVVCVARRRWLLAAQLAVLVGGSNATTQILKHMVYDRPHLLSGWNRPNSLPSGHTTVAASVALALLIAVPRRWRPTVAVLGAGWTAATGFSTLVGQWHSPADVVAAVLVVAVWALAVCALTTRSTLDVVTHGRPDARQATVGATVLLAVLGAVAGAAAGAALLSLGSGSSGGDVGLIAYAGGVAGVVAVTALVFAAVLALRQATARPGP